MGYMVINFEEYFEIYFRMIFKANVERTVSVVFMFRSKELRIRNSICLQLNVRNVI